MATGTLNSVEEYLCTSYDPDCDYVDGALIERRVGSQLHGLLQTLVASHLLRLSKQHRLAYLQKPDC